MESSFLVNLRQTLPDYLVSSLALAGVTSLDLFLALSDDRVSSDVIPVPEVVRYLREQLPLLRSRDQLQTYLPPGLKGPDQDLESVRVQAANWSIPPATKYLLFRVRADLEAQVEALELSSAKARCLAKPAASSGPRLLPFHKDPPPAEAGSNSSPAKVPRLSTACGDVSMLSLEEAEKKPRHRTRKRSKRSKKPAPEPSAPIQVSSTAVAPIQVSSPAALPIQRSSPPAAPIQVSSPAALPIQRSSPAAPIQRSSPAAARPPVNKTNRPGHVIFDSDGEVVEEREPCLPAKAVELAQNRRLCKSKPSFEFPEMSKETQLKSRQKNRSFFLKVSYARMSF